MKPLLLALLFVPAIAAAQAAIDPMRPPRALAPSEANGASPVVGGAPVLQSVMLSPKRRAAIISGQLVRLGEKYGDAVLAEVAENEVVLNRGGTLEVLKLYPGVEKREVTPLGEEPAPSPRRR